METALAKQKLIQDTKFQMVYIRTIPERPPRHKKPKKPTNDDTSQVEDSSDSGYDDSSPELSESSDPSQPQQPNPYNSEFSTQKNSNFPPSRLKASPSRPSKSFFIKEQNTEIRKKPIPLIPSEKLLKHYKRPDFWVEPTLSIPETSNEPSESNGTNCKGLMATNTLNRSQTTRGKSTAGIKPMNTTTFRATEISALVGEKFRVENIFELDKNFNEHFGILDLEYGLERDSEEKKLTERKKVLSSLEGDKFSGWGQVYDTITRDDLAKGS